MNEQGRDSGGGRVRLVHEITPGFSVTKPDIVFDQHLDAFFNEGVFPDVDVEALNKMEPEEKNNTLRRIENLRRLEDNAEGRRFCTELRDEIRKYFVPGGGQIILLEAMKFTLRVHIDDKDRTDSGLPGVSHQMKVAKDVLSVIAMDTPLDRYDATILAAAMFHDIVEDHERLLLLEQDKLAALYKQSNSKGEPILSEGDSTKTKVITLLEDESGIPQVEEGRTSVIPNLFMGQILRLLTLDRVELFKTWDGLSHEEAVKAADRLKAKRDEVSPDVYAENEAKKRELYGLYTLNTFTTPSRAGEAASLIKIMDLRDNALTIGRIRRRYEVLERQRSPERDEDLEKKISELRNKYEDLKEKYKTPLLELYKALPGWPKNTLVGRISESLQKEVEQVFEKEYGILGTAAVTS